MLSDFKEMKDLILDLYSSSNHQVGEVPGHVKIKKNEFANMEMLLVNYNEAEIRNVKIEKLNELRSSIDSEKVSWLTVNGIEGNSFLEELMTELSLHGLVIEDILNSTQHPKIEFYEEGIFLVLRSVMPGLESIDTTTSIFISKSDLYLFSPRNEFVLGKKITQRLEKSRGAIRRKGVDYLLFALIDIIVDSYFPLVDKLALSIKEIDEGLFERKSSGLIKEIKTIRQLLNAYFDNLYPLKDIIEKLKNDENGFIFEDNQKYYNHVLGHINYLCERIIRLKESTSDIMNLHISVNGQNMNEVMKVLTMMSSIFIPLSFICGLYGMNFSTERSPYNMPELSWYYGYPFALSMMLLLVIGMVVYFVRKGWFK